MIVVDTNVLSELMRREPDRVVVAWMDGFKRSEVAITAISVAEILYGVGALPEGGKKRYLAEALETLFEKYFAGRIMAFERLAAVEYARIVIERERLGRPISMPDGQIAAICRVLGVELATRNTKDFENTGITVINPWSP